MDVKRFLSDSYRRRIDHRINKLIVGHQVKQAHNASRPTTSGAVARLSPLPDLEPEDSSFSMETATVLYKAKCRDLEIAENPLAEQRFVEQFMGAINQKSLRFQGLGMGPQCLGMLLKLLRKNPQFIYIDFSLNSSGDTGARMLAEYFASNPPVIYVNLRSNGIGVSGSAEIFTGLKKNFHVTALDMGAIGGIDRNRIGTDGCRALALLLDVNQTISNLNVSMCGITVDGCTFLGEVLATNRSLMSLDLSGNRFGTAGACALFRKDGSMGALETLILARNGIGDAATVSICKQLELSKTIRALDLSNNDLGKEFLERLYNALSNGVKLERLGLAGNKLGPESVDNIRTLLKSIQTIKFFDISKNLFKDKGLIQIAEALSQNSTLVSLDLADTGMYDVSAKEFAKVLATHPSLQRLYLDENTITDEAGVPLAKALESNKVLSILSLSNNELRDRTCDALLKALTVNYSIVELNIAYNDFSARAYANLCTAIDKHQRFQNSNISEVANRHISWLKEKEAKLFQCRADIKDKQMAVEAAEGKRVLKLEELENLKVSKAKQIADAEAVLDDLEKQRQEKEMFRRERYGEFNTLKHNLERRQAKAEFEYQTVSAKRQQLQGQFVKKKALTEDATSKRKEELGLLEVRVKDAREQLRSVVRDLLQAKKMMLEKEQEEEAARKAEEAEKRKARKRSAKSKGGKRGEKMKKKNKAANINGKSARDLIAQIVSARSEADKSPRPERPPEDSQRSQTEA